MADNEKKSTMKEFVTNGQANYYSGIASITVNGKNAYELKGKFLDDLHDNAFSGTYREDAVKNIEYFVKIVDPIDLPNFWKKNDSHDEVVNDGFSYLKEANNDDEQEIGEIFRIETNLFNYDTPLCMKFNEFSYLLKVDPELFTYDVERKETYEDYKNEFNDELEEPWSENGVPYEIGDHISEPFRFKNGEAK
ncbi:hypothetical protein Tco_0989430 [Tanacetum coccineum]|uniref:Uncharacterized protein n=1 Tax=Tanacetum coccineum TaxID=301880 RepID=A0ABQ5ETL4_9ASTR